MTIGKSDICRKNIRRELEGKESNTIHVLDCSVCYPIFYPYVLDHFVGYGVASILHHTKQAIDINEQIFIRHSCT